MRVGYEVRSCYDCFTGRTSHHYRFAAHLAFKIKGQTKVINVARSILDVVGYTTKRGGVDYANNVLGDVKLILNVVNLPNEGASLARKSKKAQKSYRHFYYAFRSGKLGRRDWVDVGVQSSGLLKKTFTFAGDCFFKPLLFIGRFVDMGKTGKSVNKTWQVCSIVKSSLKIAHGSGTLYLRQENCNVVKTAKKVAETILEIGEMILTIFTYRSIRIHRIAPIILSGCKALYGLAEVWLRTA